MVLGGVFIIVQTTFAVSLLVYTIINTTVIVEVHWRYEAYARNVRESGSPKGAHLTILACSTDALYTVAPQ